MRPLPSNSRHKRTISFISRRLNSGKQSFLPTRRDVLLAILGASTFMLLNHIFNPPVTDVSSELQFTPHEPIPEVLIPAVVPAPKPDPTPESNRPPRQLAPTTSAFPVTKVTAHAPGWTLFENVYMANGTLYIIHPQAGANDEDADEYDPRAEYPEVRMMTSPGLPAENTPENIALREPTDRDLSFLTIQQAKARWGPRVYPVEGHTWLWNDPGQFINHYYHFAAELFLGTWSFYSGVMDPSITSDGRTTTPPPTRAIFPHCTPQEWRDSSKMNSFFLRSTFPDITVETSDDWKDRVFMTRNNDKAWLFKNLLLADRSASFRGQHCGSETHRTASEPFYYHKGKVSKWWWEPIRRAVLRYAGIPEEVQNIALRWKSKLGEGVQGLAETPAPKVVVTYINRQGGRRRLIPEHHEALVAALTDLCQRKGWEFNDVQAQHLTQEEQMALAAKTTVMVGVHGNGLTHLILMAPTPVSTVIEIFYPGGFAHDYEWTTRALGMKHYSVWNDTLYSWPSLPWVDYPEGFQGTQIPVHGETVAKLVEDRIEERHVVTAVAPP